MKTGPLQYAAVIGLVARGAEDPAGPAAPAMVDVLDDR